MHANNREEIDKAYQMDPPTEEELKIEFPEWDDLSDFEKKIGKDNLHNKKITTRIRHVRAEQKQTEDEIKEYVNNLEVHTIKPDTLKKYPLLDGKQNALRKFAQDVPTRIGMNFDDLIELFLVKTAKPKQNNKGGMFPGNQGGPKPPPNKNAGKIGLIEARAIREKDYGQYKRLVEQNKIDFSLTWS